MRLWAGGGTSGNDCVDQGALGGIMTEYRCDDCGEIFEEQDAGRRSEQENDGLTGDPYRYSIYYSCPFCGSDDIDEYEEYSPGEDEEPEKEGDAPE